MNKVLYLASQSSSRKYLIEQLDIPFQVFPQSADEQACDWTLPLEQLVDSIALHKMESLDCSYLPQWDTTLWVVTADTLGQDGQGRIYGKPRDRVDAINQIKNQRNQWMRVATSYYLDRKKRMDDCWIIDQRVTKTVVSSLYFSIADHEIDAYITKAGALQCAGSITIDGFGAPFVKEVQGSYSSIIGLPLYELMQDLKSLGFYE